jgi:dolichol-phosphate mannosyltransferase
VREILVVDSNSKDGTQEIVRSFAKKDSRIRLITDDPLPNGWVGRPWALHTGYLNSSQESEWIMGLDADTQPEKGIVAGILQKAESENYDLITLGPKFILKFPGEIWLQPALLVTFIYRFGAPGFSTKKVDKLMANGQLFFVRRSVLNAVDGYKSARGSFCDDVTLARNIAAKGYKVQFMDGSQVLKVRMYEGMKETWVEWGRSLDLKDATSKNDPAPVTEIPFIKSGQTIPKVESP